MPRSTFVIFLARMVADPALTVQVILRDVPELGYRSHASPARGELCIASPSLASGYWLDRDLTSSAFVSMRGKRFFRTGDIAERGLDDFRVDSVETFRGAAHPPHAANLPATPLASRRVPSGTPPSST